MTFSLYIYIYYCYIPIEYLFFLEILPFSQHPQVPPSSPWAPLAAWPSQSLPHSRLSMWLCLKKHHGIPQVPRLIISLFTLLNNSIFNPPGSRERDLVAEHIEHAVRAQNHKEILHISLFGAHVWCRFQILSVSTCASFLVSSEGWNHP